MTLDKFGNAIYSANDLVQLMYAEQSISQVYVEDSPEIQSFENLSGIRLQKINPEIYNISIEEYDSVCQSEWLIPNKYQSFDIAEFCLNKCSNVEEVNRVLEELDAFEQRNLLPLLRTLKYIVDTLRKNNVLWGVGRGSSVASYVLYLLDVHKINSLRHGLDWREFLK